MRVFNTYTYRQIITLIFRQIAILVLFSSGMAYAEKTQWELGIGLAVLDIPFYPGSSQQKTYFVPLPHLLYRSENLKIENGIDATLLRTSRTRFNISADFGVPVNSQESDIRSGMPDLNSVIQAGPSLEVTLAGGRFKAFHLHMDLPVRAAIATDLRSIENVGWLVEPRISYETRRFHKTGFAHLISLGLRYSNEALHDFYYKVSPEFAVPGRPQFDAKGGYSGLSVNYIASLRTNDFIFFALLRYQNLSGAAFERSPLVEQNSYLMIGAGVSWIFARNL